MNGRIHSIETFGTVDGPGIRFVVFLQGCRWRCRYCHNPDTWRLDDGAVTDAETLARQAMRYKAWFDSSGGGVTVTGGEPLLQAAFVAEFFRLCHAAGIHTCLDTSGDDRNKTSRLDETSASQASAGAIPIQPDVPDDASTSLDALLRETDLVLLDLKESDPDAHRALTGADPSQTLAFANTLARRDIPVVVRHVVVPGLTGTREQVERLVRLALGYPNVREIQWLPYHRLGVYKWHELGLSYPLEDTPAAPESLMEQVRAWEKAVRADCQPSGHSI